MNKSSSGLFVVIIVFLLIGIGLYFVLAGKGDVPVMVTPPVGTTAPAVITPPAATTTTTTTSTTTTTIRTPFILTADQKKALLTYGISSSSIPATVSATQEACFVTTLGAPRVAEIKAGAVPTAIEFAKAKGCI